MWSQIVAWLGSAAAVSFFKKIGKIIWDYAWGFIQSLWNNFWIILIASTCSGLFIYYYNMLYSWFAFPPLLNYAILGIFAIINFSWVVGYWKSPPDKQESNSSGPSVSTGN